MVFVSMRKNNSLELVALTSYVIEIGNDQVDTMEVGFGELHPDVDQKELALILEER